MTVRNLLQILDTLNPNLEIILQKDAEGNGYSPLSNYSLQVYEAYNDWSGDIVDEPSEDSKPVLVLVPTN